MPQPNGPRRSLLDLCTGLFIAALLIYFAVQLVVAVLVPLLIIAAVALGIGLAVRLILWRRQGW